MFLDYSSNSNNSSNSSNSSDSSNRNSSDKIALCSRYVFLLPLNFVRCLRRPRCAPGPAPGGR